MENETEGKKPEKKKFDRAKLKGKLKDAAVKFAIVTAGAAAVAGASLTLNEKGDIKSPKPKENKQKSIDDERLTDQEMQEKRTYTAWTDSVAKQYNKADEEYADSVLEERIKNTGETMPEHYKERRTVELAKEHALERAEKGNPEMAKKGEKVRAADKRVEKVLRDRYPIVGSYR